MSGSVGKIKAEQNKRSKEEVVRLVLTDLQALWDNPMWTRPGSLILQLLVNGKVGSKVDRGQECSARSYIKVAIRK